MKIKLTALLLSVSLLFAFKMLNDVLTDVGTTLQEVKQITVEQIAKKNFDLPRYTGQIRDACKKLPPGVREVTMMNLGKVVKDYVQSGSFQSEYMAYIENQPAGGGRRGAPPMDDAKWAAEKKKRTDQMIKGMTPDAIKIYAETLDIQLQASEDMLKLLEESPDLKIGKSKEELQKEIKETKMLKELYAKDVDAFKIKYAELAVDKQLSRQMDQQKTRQAETQERINELKDYKAIIANQLQQFLDLSATIDFNAQTTQKGDKIVFVNPAYESKPAAWKLCFRSGKEAVTGARKFAQQWLNEMKAGA